MTKNVRMERYQVAPCRHLSHIFLPRSVKCHDFMQRTLKAVLIFTGVNGAIVNTMDTMTTSTNIAYTIGQL